MKSGARETLAIENRLAEMARVERWLAELAERWTLSARASFAVDLVINEALTNVIRHGYDDPGTHEIRISLDLQPGAIVLQIEDDGQPFNPFAAALPSPVPDLDHAAIGGRGILLIRSYTSAHDYHRVGGYNRLTLEIPTVP
jgi:anti-sigma regulatory factor (Ser/Thr protein kinase)